VLWQHGVPDAEHRPAGEAGHAGQPFFLAVGFVRPHVPFVAPRKYFAPYLPYEKLALPEKVAGDWDDIPKAGINYKTSVNMKMDVRRQKKAIGGYYACVSFMDAQVGKVLDAVTQAGLFSEKAIIPSEASPQTRDQGPKTRNRQS